MEFIYVDDTIRKSKLSFSKQGDELVSEVNIWDYVTNAFGWGARRVVYGIPESLAP